MFIFIMCTFLAFMFVSPFIPSGDIIVSFSKSFMVGVLYDRYYVEDEEVYDNTIQFAFVFLLITFKWDSK